MRLKERIEKLKKVLELNRKCDLNTINNIVRDAAIGNKKIYRLHYINYHKIGGEYGLGSNGKVDWPFDVFYLPEGMSKDDAFKVLSYLTDFIEKSLDLPECSFKAVNLLNEALKLERFGFRKVETSVEPQANEIADLFTLSGRTEQFKKSKYAEQYFEWYTPNVSKQEVETIYHKLGKRFEELKLTVKGNKITTSSDNCEYFNLPIYRFQYSQKIGTISKNTFTVDFTPFVALNGISQENVFKVLSYLLDYIATNNINDSKNGVYYLQRLEILLSKENSGFAMIEEDIDVNNITNLVVTKNDEENIAPWYIRNVTREEVLKIYSDCGLDFNKLIPETKKHKKYISFLEPDIVKVLKMGIQNDEVVSHTETIEDDKGHSKKIKKDIF